MTWFNLKTLHVYIENQRRASVPQQKNIKNAEKSINSLKK